MKGSVVEVKMRLLLPDPAEMASCEGVGHHPGVLSVMEAMRLKLLCDEDQGGNQCY